MQQVADLSFDWFEPMAGFHVSVRTKLEAAGVEFKYETEPPLSTDAGPVSSAGIRLQDGSEFWLVAMEDWRDGEFLPERSHDSDMKLELRAAPEQFAAPANALAAFREELQVDEDEIEWAPTEWDEFVVKGLEQRR
jgi:hypothetical protein